VPCIKLLTILLFAIASAGAVQPIASITSASSFELRGHTVNVGGVPTWPVAPGDDITAGKESATVQLRDGSRVLLLQGSHLRIDVKDENVVLSLLSGSLRMGSAVNSKISLYVHGSLVKPVPGAVVSAGPRSGVAQQGSESRRVMSLPIPISHR
jgi:hypothetical protein